MIDLLNEAAAVGAAGKARLRSTGGGVEQSLNGAAYSAFADIGTAQTLTGKTLTSATLGNNLAAGGFKVTGLADGTAPGDAATFRQVVQGRTFKEAVLHQNQLAAGGAGGIRQAIAFYAAGLPAVLDTFIITDGVTTETFTVRAAEVAAFDVAQGASANTFMTNLAQAINDDSVLCDAVLSTTLNKINATDGRVVAVYSINPADGNLRLRGTWGTQANAKYINYNAELDYTKVSTSTLPTADPAQKEFGFGRTFANLLAGETHLALSDDNLRTWDADANAWNVSGGAGVYSGGAGMTLDGTVFNVGAGNASITVNADSIQVNEAFAFTWTALHTHQATVVGRQYNPEADNTYDHGTAALRWRDIFLSSSVRVLAAINDAQPSVRVGTNGFEAGVGGATALDWRLFRQAADVAELASGDSLFTVGTGIMGRKGASADANATAQVGSNGFELGAGAAAAVDWRLLRQAADVAEMASADSLYAVGTGAMGRKAASGDANATLDLSSAGLRLGAGGVTAVDWVLARQAADVAELGSGDSMHAVGTGVLGRRAASADANTTAQISSNGFELGVGGVTALDWRLFRQAADVAELATGDSLHAVGTGVVGRRAASADANPTISISSAGLQLGVGGATAVDWTLARQAADIAELGGGDSLFSVGAGLIGRKAVAADANATVEIDAARIAFGAGGATAVDTILARTAAAQLDLTGTMLPEADNTRNLGSAARRWANVFAAVVTSGDIHMVAPDGSAEWTLIEEPSHIVARNDKTGRSYRLMMEAA